MDLWCSGYCKNAKTQVCGSFWFSFEILGVNQCQQAQLTSLSQLFFQWIPRLEGTSVCKVRSDVLPVTEDSFVEQFEVFGCVVWRWKDIWGSPGELHLLRAPLLVKLRSSTWGYLVAT